MWIKVGSEFPRHKKVMLAGARLGRHGSGRILAVWLAGMGYCNDNYTGGFVPRDIVTGFPHDKDPSAVADAMALPISDDEAAQWGFPDDRTLLWIQVPGGYRVHNYDEYNGVAAELSRTRSVAGRKGGMRSGQVRRGEANASSKHEANQEANDEATASSKPTANSEANPLFPEANAKPGTGTYLLLRSKCTETPDTYCAADASRFPQAVENTRKKASVWKRALAIAHQVIDEFPDHPGNWHPETKTRLIEQHINHLSISPRGGQLSQDAVDYAERQRKERGERLERPSIPAWPRAHRRSG